ncbi:unnamed protein product, partial [marine sediment metagenome]
IIDDDGNENIKAYVVLKEEFKGKISEQDIIDWAKENMGFDKYPRKWLFFRNVPRFAKNFINFLFIFFAHTFHCFFILFD